MMSAAAVCQGISFLSPVGNELKMRVCCCESRLRRVARAFVFVCLCSYMELLSVLSCLSRSQGQTSILLTSSWARWSTSTSPDCPPVLGQITLIWSLLVNAKYMATFVISNTVQWIINKCSLIWILLYYFTINCERIAPYSKKMDADTKYSTNILLCFNILEHLSMQIHVQFVLRVKSNNTKVYFSLMENIVFSPMMPWV